ncbi:MAG: hypothetical protein OEM63_13795 [Gammaproteobacteria bacterium]|nr:hypothetical protein [Gammaproteobacteria bacterium]
MTHTTKLLVLLLALAGPGTLNADNEGPNFHEDYYLGFSQGAYYGLMLAGIEYDVAWCVKGELDYAGAALGSGSDFQQNIERIFESCNDSQ